MRRGSALHHAVETDLKHRQKGGDPLLVDELIKVAESTLVESVDDGVVDLESDPELVRIAGEAYDRAFPDTADAPGLMIGTVVSGDKFVKDSETLRWLQREFSALATEMEGAAVGYTCGLSNVPFVVIRGISDGAGETAHTDFKDNLHKVCQNSYRILEEFVPLYGAL